MVNITWNYRSILVLALLALASCGGGGGGSKANDDDDDSVNPDDDDSVPADDDDTLPTTDDDDDPCEALTCEHGCENGECLPAPCEDECALNDFTCGEGNTVLACGNFDEDECLEYTTLGECGYFEVCEDGSCLPRTNECGVAIDPYDTLDQTWALTFDANAIATGCQSPPTNPLICSQFPGLLGAAVANLGFYFVWVEGNDEPEVWIAQLDAQNIQNDDILGTTSFDIEQNPCLSFTFENISFKLADLTLSLKDLTIEGAISNDLNSIYVTRLEMRMDATALTDLVGIDVCTLGLCEPDGTIVISVNGPVASKIEGLVLNSFTCDDYPDFVPDYLEECYSNYTCCATGYPVCCPGFCCPEGTVCGENECIDTCTNECTTGSSMCASDTASTQCGNFDEDPCLEWGLAEECGAGDACTNGHCKEQCVSDCVIGERQCNGPTSYQTCADTDLDTCLEWVAAVNCPTGQTCSNGNCASSCSDECAVGKRECSDAVSYRTCGDYDTDSCRDWSSPTSCGAGNICQAGACVSACSNDCTAGAKQCSSSTSYQACGNYDADSCLEWSAIVSCGSGYICSFGNCLPNGCSNLCTSGTSECVGSTSVRYCGNFDSDACTEWSTTIGCGAGKTCISGLCLSNGSGQCNDLELRAQDYSNTYLGQASSNPYGGDSVCNEYSQYGSQYGSYSIYNEYGSYGSAYGSYSAYNKYTSNPPRLYCTDDGSWRNTVSANPYASGNPIHPDVLCQVLANNGY